MVKIVNELGVKKVSSKLEEDDYKDTKKFWNKVFKESKKYNPTEVIQIERIPQNLLEESIKWLCDGSDSIIDFGCGSGKFIFRAIYNGASSITGIDISQEAVSLAKDIANEYCIENKCNFICGGIENLKNKKDSTFDGAILSNIIDNLRPNDALMLIKEISRIVKKNGKVLVKLNPYINKEMLEECGAIELNDEFYKEDTGLYFLNLSTIKIEEMLKEYFRIEKYKEIYFKEADMKNRIYYLINK